MCEAGILGLAPRGGDTWPTKNVVAIHHNLKSEVEARNKKCKGRSN